MKRKLTAIIKQDAGYKMHDAGCKSLSCIMYRASCIRSHHAFRIPHSAFRNEKGIALVMVLILSAISLAIMAGLIYMLTSGTQVSGVQKRYRTALEASKGGKDSMYDVIATRGVTTIPTSICTETWTSTCKNDKLTKSKEDWNASCDSSITINPAISTPLTYDMTCTLGSYTAYVKISDTVKGNSSESTEDLGSGKGVVDTGTEVSATQVPFLYTIEVDAQNPSNPAERAKLSVMYQY